MRFMLLMLPKGYASAPPGARTDPRKTAEMARYNDALRRAGVLLALDGLQPPALGARVVFSGGKPTVADGPFPGAPEAVGGYWLIEAKSREEAIEWAKRCPAGDGNVIEVRKVQAFADPDEIV